MHFPSIIRATVVDYVIMSKCTKQPFSRIMIVILKSGSSILVNVKEISDHTISEIVGK